MLRFIINIVLIIFIVFLFQSWINSHDSTQVIGKLERRLDSIETRLLEIQKQWNQGERERKRKEKG